VDYDWVDDFDTLKYHEDFVHDLVREVWTLNKKNVNKQIRTVYESDYMHQPGDRYHQSLNVGSDPAGKQRH
jgi:hypothetical protein